MDWEHYSKKMSDGELVDRVKELRTLKEGILERFTDLELESDSFEDGYEEKHSALCDELHSVDDDIYRVRQELKARGLIKPKGAR